MRKDFIVILDFLLFTLMAALLGVSVALLHLLWRFVVWSLHRAFDGVLK